MPTALARKQKTDLSKYDPEKGVKRIAAFEMAEKHWARAKDATKLELAIRAKLEAQAEFVLWWDTSVERHQGSRTDRKPRNGSDTKFSLSGLAEQLGTSLIRISRWRRKFNASPDSFEKAVEQAVARYLRILELETIDKQLKASESNEWYTPDRYIEAARAVLGGIDLDPASNKNANLTVKAERFYTISDDGLALEWAGRVWLNPPYCGLSGPFAARLIEQFCSGNVTAAVLLVNSNSTDAAWFQSLWDYLLCFTHHRINFVSPGGAQSGSTHGSVFVYLGPDRVRCVEEFSQFGAVVERAR
jgi:ParB family chromosome partitioning protein